MNANNSTHTREAYAMADQLPPPDDLLVRVLVTQTLLVSLDPSSPLFAPPPSGFDSRPLVTVGATFFSRKDWLRDSLNSGRGADLINELVRIAAGHYQNPADLDFVGRAATLLFSKPQLLLNILDGGRDPFEGIAD